MASFESEILFKWTNSCRFCLSAECDRDIFSPLTSSPDILSGIKSSLNILIYNGDPMPRKICNICYTRVEEWTKFKDACLKTEEDLRKRLQPYKKIEFVQEYFDKLTKFSTSEVVSSSSKVILKIPAMGYEEPNSSTSPKNDIESGGPNKPCSSSMSTISSELEKVFDEALSKHPKPSSERFHLTSSVQESGPDAISPEANNSTVVAPVKRESEMESVGTIFSVTGRASALWVADEDNLKQPTVMVKQESVTCSECHTEFLSSDEYQVHECVLMEVEAPDASLFVESTLRVNEDNVEDDDNYGDDDTESSLDSSDDTAQPRRSLRQRVPVRRLCDELLEEDAFVRSSKPCPLVHKTKEYASDAECGRFKMTPWKCIPCARYFPSSHTLSEHYLSKTCNSTFSDVFKCELCTRQYTTYLELLQHQIVHIKVLYRLTDDDLVCCPQCHLQFADEQRLDRHSLVHSSTHIIKSDSDFLHRDHDEVEEAVVWPSYPCNSCKQTFQDQTALEEHKKTHSGAVRCLRCGSMFSCAQELERHESAKHKNPTPYMCRKCSLRFSIRSKLLLHLRSHLPKSDPDHCPSTEAELQAINSPANRCPTCGAKFLYDTDLQLHLKTHKAPRPVEPAARQPASVVEAGDYSGELLARYKCSLCTKVTVHPFSIIRHGQQVHRGERVVAQRLKRPIPVYRHAPASPFLSKVNKHRSKCPHCYKSFSSAANLNVHLASAHAGQPVIKTETRAGEEPDISEFHEIAPTAHAEGTEDCPYCKQSFKRSYLRQHMKRNHKGQAIDRSTLGKQITADNSLVCRFCFKVCSTTYNKELHESIHSPNADKSTPLTCSACKKVFHHRYIYERHVKSCSVAKSFHCSVCNKLFFKFSAFQKHSCQIAEDANNECHECGSKFASLNLLQVHVNNTHGGVRAQQAQQALQGQQAGTSAGKERELWQEEANKIVCKVDDKYYCTLCDCEFSTTEECRQHQTYHPRGNWYAVQIHDSLYQCTICDKFFDSRKAALLHIDYHKQSLDHQPPPQPYVPPADTRPKTTAGIKRSFRCPLCISTFATEENLSNHIYYLHSDSTGQ